MEIIKDKLFFEIKNNILTMYRGIIAADGTIETYEKIETLANDQ